MDRDILAEFITEEFRCGISDARAISEKAIQLEEQVESNPAEWNGPEIDRDYVLSCLNAAPGHISAIAKWNWYAGQLDYLDQADRDYRIR